MTRKQQDLFTRLLAAGLVLSQLVPYIPRRPELVAGAFGLLGIPRIRRAQDVVNEAEEDDHPPPKKGTKT